MTNGASTDHTYEQTFDTYDGTVATQTKNESDNSHYDQRSDSNDQKNLGDNAEARDGSSLELSNIANSVITKNESSASKDATSATNKSNKESLSNIDIISTLSLNKDNYEFINTENVEFIAISRDSINDHSDLW